MRRHWTLFPRWFQSFGWALICACAWLGSFRPAEALDPNKDFRHYVRDTWSIEQGLPQISALAIAQDRRGYLWVGTQAGLARFDGHHFVAYTPETVPALPGTYINGLLYDHHDRLWVATYKGLALGRDGVFTTVPIAGAPEAAPNIVALAETAHGRILAAADDVVYEVHGEVLKPRATLPGPAHSLMSEADALWVGSRGGVYRLRDDGSRDFLGLPEAAESAAVLDLLRAQGRVWAGTSVGLFFLDGERWQRYDDDPGLAHTPIEALREDRDGNLWVAEIAHLARLRDGRLQERIELPDASLSVRAMFEDAEGNLWLGSQWNGVTRVRSGWTHRYSVREGLHTPLLWSVATAVDDPDRLWVGTDEGLSVFEDGHFASVVPGNALPHPSAYTLLVERDAVWIGTRRGLAVWRDGRLEQPAAFAPLLGAQVNGILRDRRGQLFFATTTGLYRQSRPGQPLERFAEDAGLRDQRVRYLLERQDGSLLLGTQAGLYRFDDGRALPVGVDQGLPADVDVTVIHELPGDRLVLGSLSEELYLFDAGHWTRFGREQGMPSNAPFFLAHDDTWLWVGGIRGIHRAALAEMYALAAGRAERVHGQMLLNERGDRRGGQKGFCCNGAGNAKGLQRGDTLWAPTRDGLVALDTDDVRFPEQPPTTLIERVRTGGRWHEADALQDAELSADQRDLAFEVTAISYYDPKSIGFRYRLLGYHDDWREPDEAGQRVVAYTNLPAGDYVFEVEGSTIDDQWSPPAAYRFTIAPKFHETDSFYALIALAIVLLIVLGYRLQRHRYRLRAAELEALVQQRTEALAQANQRLQEASHTDPLTGLRNRRYLAMQIPKDMAFYGRELRRGAGIGQVIVFAICDIDHFKRINDDYGHAAGDRVLQQFAELLLRQVRTGDYVARWGGEEFVVVFRPTPTEQLPMLGERIRGAVARQPFDIGMAEPLQITCSIGLVEYPLFYDADDSIGWEQLIELADRALYHVKRHGRNGWGAYRPAPHVQPARVLELLKVDEAEFEQTDDLELIAGNG